MMFEKERREVIKAGMKLDRYDLIALAGGNISVRMPSGEILMTPSGMIYEDMVPEDVVVMTVDGKIIEGDRKPSSDTKALLYIFQQRPDINAVIHTHQPYATAIGMNNDSLPACMVTLIDANHARINVAPWTKSQDIGMGKLAVEYAGDANTVIMKHHGVISFGKDLEEALYAAVYLEEAAKTYCMARIMGSVPELTDEQIADEAAGWEVYGQ